MEKINNSDLIKEVLEALYLVVGRRTLDSFAAQIIKMTMEQLEKKYDFLTDVKIQDDLFSEDTIKTTIDPTFNSVEPPVLSAAIDALIRVVYMELFDTIGEEAGLYFIKEFKEHLGDTFVEELRLIGVNFEQIQEEQQIRYQTKTHKSRPSSSLKVEKEKQPKYTWESVSTWKYNDNICFLYDQAGRLLDTLQLDLIIEDYVERVTESMKQPLDSKAKATMLKVSEKENKLLEMIQRRDMDIESAVTLLHISRQKFNSMIRKLLQLELLQYISDNEVKLTEKGLAHLSEHQVK